MMVYVVSNSGTPTAMSCFSVVLGDERQSKWGHMNVFLRRESAAYLLNEADIAPCGRDTAALRPLVSASLRLGLARPQVGVQLSRAVKPTTFGPPRWYDVLR